nr:hypothetical transcript [Hymenolepis microstoma]
MFRATCLLLLAFAFLGATASDGQQTNNSTVSNSTAGNSTISTTPTTTSDASVAFFSSLLLLPSIIFSIQL